MWRAARRADSPEAAAGPVLCLPVTDSDAERDVYLTWPASRPPLPAAEVFRTYVIRTVSAGRIRPVSGSADVSA